MLDISWSFITQRRVIICFPKRVSLPSGYHRNLYLLGLLLGFCSKFIILLLDYIFRMFIRLQNPRHTHEEPKSVKMPAEIHAQAQEFREN